ncbi:hypothetical protein ACQ86F_25710 [Streptomyces venezuelae ATCC 10712]
MLITNTAVQEAALTLAQRLTLADPAAGTWATDPEAPADGAAHLIHEDGRGLSFRPIFGGTTAQIWITGAPAPSLPAGATPAEQDAHQAQLALRLAAGHRYNKAVTLLAEDDDVDPADLILDTVENHLLPAFTLKPHYVGHRPWDDLFAAALGETDAEPEVDADVEPTPDAELETDSEPEADEDVEPTPDAEPEVDADVEPTPVAEPEVDADVEPTPDAEPAPDSEPEVDADLGATSGRAPGSEDPDTAVSTPQQSTDTAPASEEPQAEDATADSRPTAKRRQRRAAKKSAPRTTS